MKEQTEVVILGKEEVKTYRYRSHYNYIYELSEVISNPLIWEGLLDNPPLKECDYIYIDDINKDVQIEKVVRSTSNKYIYYVDSRVGELIENEHTQETLEQAKNEQKQEEESQRLCKEEKELREKEKQKTKLQKILDIIKS